MATHHTTDKRIRRHSNRDAQRTAKAGKGPADSPQQHSRRPRRRQSPRGKQSRPRQRRPRATRRTMMCLGRSLRRRRTCNRRDHTTTINTEQRGDELMMLCSERVEHEARSRHAARARTHTVQASSGQEARARKQAETSNDAHWWFVFGYAKSADDNFDLPLRDPACTATCDRY